MTSRNGTAYSYGTKPHAVTGVGSYVLAYDANGNMTSRQNATGTQTLVFDADNRLYSIAGTGGGYSGTTYFYYDGDGTRIKKVEGGETTVYVNKYYEKNATTGEETSHYYLGGKQIALKRDIVNPQQRVLEYLHHDHLSSTSVSTYSSGIVKSTKSYLPYGATRSESGVLGTAKMFTSQRLDNSTDLYFYNARYYDQGLGRFISADTIVPDFRNPQALNRYSYVYNNPLKYTDPDGEFPWLAMVAGAFVSAMAYTVATVAINTTKHTDEGVWGAMSEGFKALDARDFAEAAVIGGLTAGVGTLGVVASAIEKATVMPAPVVLNVAGGFVQQTIDVFEGQTTPSAGSIVSNTLFSALPGSIDFEMPASIQNNAWASAGVGIADSATSALGQYFFEPNDPQEETSYDLDLYAYMGF